MHQSYQTKKLVGCFIVIRPKNPLKGAHAMAGLLCGETAYIYDSNNYTHMIDWRTEEGIETLIQLDLYKKHWDEEILICVKYPIYV